MEKNKYTQYQKAGYSWCEKHTKVCDFFPCIYEKWWYHQGMPVTCICSLKLTNTSSKPLLTQSLKILKIKVNFEIQNASLGHVCGTPSWQPIHLHLISSWCIVPGSICEEDLLRTVTGNGCHFLDNSTIMARLQIPRQAQPHLHICSIWTMLWGTDLVFHYS